MRELLEYLQKKKITSSDLTEYRHLVDLDLPSKNLWCTCNLGSEHPLDTGDYYIWNSTDKDEIQKNVYPASAKATKDPAKLELGEDYHVATVGDWAELLDCCDVKYHSGSPNYLVFTSRANQQTLQLPAVGVKMSTGNIRVSKYGYYLTDETAKNKAAKIFTFTDKGPQFITLDDCKFQIRAVKKQ